MFTTIKQLREEYKNIPTSNLMNLCLDRHLLPKILKYYPKCFETESILIEKDNKELKYEILMPCFPKLFTLYLSDDMFYIKYKSTRHVKSVDRFYSDEQNFFQVMCKRVIDKYYKNLPQKENILRLIDNDFELGLILFKSQLYEHIGIENLKKDYDKLLKYYHGDQDKTHEVLSKKYNISQLSVSIYTTYF